MRRLIRLILVLVLAPTVSSAKDDLKTRAEAAWLARDKPEQALLAIDLFKELSRQNPNDFESRIFQARAAYWVLEEMRLELDKSQKIKMCESAIQGLHEILGKDEENVAAWYWLVWDLGALTMIKGPFSGWSLKEGIIGTIMVSKGDVNYHYGGIYRYWGRVIYETPGMMKKFLHFADGESVWIYQRAIKAEPKYLRNHFYLAETYEKMGQKDQARKEYEFCASLPEGALPEIIPETRFYKRLGREKLDNLGEK